MLQAAFTREQLLWQLMRQKPLADNEPYTVITLVCGRISDPHFPRTGAALQYNHPENCVLERWWAW